MWYDVKELWRSPRGCVFWRDEFVCLCSDHRDTRETAQEIQRRCLHLEQLKLPISCRAVDDAAWHWFADVQDTSHPYLQLLALCPEFYIHPQKGILVWHVEDEGPREHRGVYVWIHHDRCVQQLPILPNDIGGGGVRGAIYQLGFRYAGVGPHLFRKQVERFLQLNSLDPDYPYLNHTLNAPRMNTFYNMVLFTTLLDRRRLYTAALSVFFGREDTDSGTFPEPIAVNGDVMHKKRGFFRWWKR